MKRAILLLLIPGLLSAASTNAPPPEDLTVVYIHGFGGKKENPKFVENLEAFFKKHEVSWTVENYPWDSVKVDVLQAGGSWRASEEKADLEGKDYKVKVIDRLEKEGRPYILVGFSVGSRVVLRGLEEAGGNLKHLRGVYFLGSAMTKDTTLARSLLPEDLKIISYHSPLKDSVHQIAFGFMNTEDAGGRVGFDDAKVFDNYPVSCTHTHKNMPIASDYSQLANAIGYIALYREGIRLPGRTRLNLKSKVGEGDVWWNKVLTWPCKIKGKVQTVEFEQNSLKPDYFRALITGPDGKRKRVARGSNLHAILKKLNAEEPK